jgi:tetratricopeptide (TPR) repeat protein
VLDPERQELQSQSTENLEAYDYYLRGNVYMERGCYQEENARVAVNMFQKAVKLDPEFVLAHAKLTEAHLAMYFFRHDHSEARLALAKQTVDVAVSLAPDLPEVDLPPFFGPASMRGFHSPVLLRALACAA